jgi:hypothetical protein
MTGRRGLLALAVAALVGLPACGGGDGKADDAMDSRLQSLANAGVFVGGVAYTNTLVAMHFERPGKDKDISNLRIFVADGAPGGTAEWFEGKPDKNTFKFTSAGGKATIDAGGMWTGKSLDGSTFEATQTGPTVDGFVRSASGDLFKFKQNDLTRRLDYPRQGGQPDTYTLIVTRQATEIVGRGGAVRQGRPSDNIVALDLAASPVPTPGVFYGRVALTTDKLAFDIKDQAGGRKQLRAYVSDAEPEPAGDIEWFTAMTTGNTFSVTSASGNAKLDGTIAADGVSGTITLPDAPARRYFAGPAGEGAGIYDVTVAQDRSHSGTSEEGAKLQLTYKEGMVMGEVTAPTGEKVDLLGADLAEAYRYGVQGSLPGTYVAFAAPRGRFLIGRNGDVRAGRPGVNIIGLDKKC